MLKFFEKGMLGNGLIDKTDLKLYEVVDTAEAAVKKVMTHINKTTKAVTDNIKYEH
jgi:predicted Rossmann-fold nucleotide-binding protein